MAPMIPYLLGLALACSTFTHAVQPSSAFQKRDLPSCAATAKSPPPKGFVCGRSGSVSGAVISTTGQAFSFDECRATCLAKSKSKCLAFSYEKSTKACIQYLKPIKYSGFTKSDSGVMFWNRACYKYDCTCPNPNQNLCSGDCTDLQSDSKNCGSCGKRCPDSAGCDHGACYCDDETENICNGQCTNQQTDSNNCGSCGNTCPTSQGCAGGECACTDTAEDICDGQCTNQQTDNNNCGSCGNVCPASTSCNGGTCTCDDTAENICNGQCTNQQTDNNNCGSCGNVCSSLGSCSTGLCSCPTSQAVDNPGFESGSLNPWDYEALQNIIGATSSEVSIVNDPNTARSGSYYASISDSTRFGFLDFVLSQTVSVCQGTTYQLDGYSSSTCPSSGSGCGCVMEACVGDACTAFDPPGGNTPGGHFGFTWKAVNTSSVEVKIRVQDFYGVRICGRQTMNFDDIALTVVTS